MSLWGWLSDARQYILNVVDRVLGRDAERVIVDTNININKNDVISITQNLIDDVITVGDWEAQMRDALKAEYIQQYLLGIGGEGNLSQKDYGSIGGMLHDQYRYLDNFAQQIADGELTPGQVMMRAQMYANSARESFGRARGRAYGIPDGSLPDYPGSGRSCLGLTSCRCFWDIIESDEGWDCYWRLGAIDDNNCDLCLEHTSEWNPYFIPYEEAKE
jgi:hypothetical protein